MNKGISGIYKITNIVNNKFYIGSSYTIKRRWNAHNHYLRKNNHDNKYLQNSYNKYGKENFKFEIIEECLIENLITREQYYIDTLNPQYNLCRIASRITGIKLSEETKRKMSLAKKGTVRTKEHIQNWRISMGITKLSEEHKEKIRLKSKKKKVLQYSMDGELIKKFESVREAGRQLNIDYTAILKCCKNKLNYSKGFKFKYYEEY